MSVKEYEVSGELDMDASKYGTVRVKTNLLKKAYKLGEEALKKKYNAFYVTNISIKEVNSDGS